jgi:AcrR family transcriptional regulator
MEHRQGRREAVSHLKRSLILDAARRVFENDGLEGASLRAIAAEAGYTPAALYFHFDSKEAIYAELLTSSLAALRVAVDAAVAAATSPAGRLRAPPREQGDGHPSHGGPRGRGRDHRNGRVRVACDRRPPPVPRGRRAGQVKIGSRFRIIARTGSPFGSRRNSSAAMRHCGGWQSLTDLPLTAVHRLSGSASCPDLPATISGTTRI